MWTSHGFHIQGTAIDLESRPKNTARCGGPGLCKVCSAEAASAINRLNNPPKENPVDPKTPSQTVYSLDELPFIEKGKQLVAKHANKRLEITDESILDSSGVYVVWFCKTLQHWKALFSTVLPDSMIYEVTYNGDKKEAYVDSYKKWENGLYKDEDGE